MRSETFLTEGKPELNVKTLVGVKRTNWVPELGRRIIPNRERSVYKETEAGNKMWSLSVAGGETSRKDREEGKTGEDWRIESMKGSWFMFLILWQIEITEGVKQGSNIVRYGFSVKYSGYYIDRRTLRLDTGTLATELV